MRHWKIIIWLVGALLLFGAVGLNTSSARTTSQTQALEPGSSLTLTCTTRITFVRSADRKTITVTCAPLATPRPTQTQAATQTQPAPTATAQPTNTPAAPTSTLPPPTASATPTEHHHPPTATPATRPSSTPVPGGNGLAPVDPDILGTCSAEVHDRYVVTGPNGKLYRTWHPQEVPVDANNPNGPKCRFAHEHGDDPTQSLANPSLPAFGYINDVGNHPEEAHQGFKVFVVNRGQVNDEGRTARTHTRLVAHMGTAGTRRFTMQHHSMQFDLRAVESNHYVSVQGLADTALAGSICERDRNSSDNDSSNDIGRTVVTTRGSGCDLGSLYEIWLFSFRIRNGSDEIANVMASTAAFDPITVMNPNNRSELIYTWDPRAYPEWGQQYGCDREAYHGPVYWYNQGGPTVYYTDAFGNVSPNGVLRQEISQHATIGIPMSPDQNLFKYRSNACAPGLGLKN